MHAAVGHCDLENFSHKVGDWGAEKSKGGDNAAQNEAERAQAAFFAP